MKVNNLPDVNYSLDFDKDLADSFENFGFQASEIYKATKVCETMKKQGATIFLSLTSNLVATGLRPLIAYLCKKKFVDVIITAGGAIDHDIILSFTKYKHGSFDNNDLELHRSEVNRLGNILISNSNYVLLEEKVVPVLKHCAKNNITAPSKIIEEFASVLDDENSILYQCKKNNIPIFCPGLIDSAIGLQSYFIKQQNIPLIVDTSADLLRLGRIVLDSEKTGAIILGGGISKHHTIASNILREGLDFAVYISTASAFDGSLSGASSSEAISWGKIKEENTRADVKCDATIAFPIIVRSLHKRGIL